MAFRTQKISQMTPKGADLEATDLIEVSTIESGSYVTRSITGQEIIDAAVGNVDWGDIGGTLSAQTDLQNALDAKVPTTRTLTINGVTQDLSADRTFTIATGLTVGTTPISSGTVGRVLFQGTGNVVQQSGNLFWDNAANQFIIGGSTASNVRANTNEFNIQRDGLTVPTNGNQLMFNLVGNGQGMSITNQNGTTYRIGQFSVSNVLTLGAAGNNTLNLFTSGNVGIGTTTDAGFRLDVNGTARVKTDLKIETATGGLIIEGDASGYPTLKINTLRSGTTRRNWMFATEQINGGDFILFRSATAGGVANTLVYSIFNDGNFGLNTSTNAGFRLDVNGTARVQGDLTLTSTFAVKMNNNNRWVGASQLYAGVQIYAAATGTDVIQMTAGGQVHISSAGGITTQASSIVQIDSTTKGFLPPRMTTTQKNAIASPAAGLMVYDTTLNVISYYNGSMWI